MHFILKEKDREMKINFTNYICDNLQKQLIIYRNNERGMKEHKFSL